MRIQRLQLVRDLALQFPLLTQREVWPTPLVIGAIYVNHWFQATATSRVDDQGRCRRTPTARNGHAYYFRFTLRWGAESNRRYI